MELKGSKTEQNLMAAFAGESQARNKYTYYASKARKEGYEQIVLLRCGNDAVQIGEAAKNGVTTAIIADSLQQAEADGPDEADAQRIIEHGAVMLAEGNAGIDGTCLRKAGQNITHDELDLEKNRISGQKLAAEG